jgi:hypothetical protein
MRNLKRPFTGGAGDFYSVRRRQEINNNNSNRTWRGSAMG